MAAQHLPWISPDEFLDAEAASDSKHHYDDGTITAMAGGSFEHGRLAGNLTGLLFAALRGRGCAVVGSDVLFQTGSQQMFTYPDVMVICGPVQKLPGRPNVITNPVLVAEVLSPSTEAVDRGEKARHYRATSSVQQYLLISQDSPRIEVHTRQADGSWLITDLSGLSATCELSSLNCSIPLAALYDGVLDV